MPERSFIESPELHDRVLRAQGRYNLAKLGLMVITSVVVIALLCLNVYMLQRAEDGRDEIRSCITPDGKCAQRGAKQSANLIAASIICTNKGYTDIDAALRCVREAMTPR